MKWAAVSVYTVEFKGPRNVGGWLRGMKLKSYLKISTAALVIASASVGIGITPAFAQQAAEDQDRGIADIGLSAFHKALLDSIPTTNSKIRYFEKIDILLEGGGAEIEAYLTTANANSGITGAEIVQLYSNMSEGYGIVTGLNTSSLDECRFSTQTVDAMNNNPDTKALNFRN